MHQTPDHAADDSSDRVSNLLAEVLAAPLAEHPDLLARLCAEHRECADALRQGYSSLQQFDLLRVGQDDGAAAPATAHETSLPRTFGTFRLLEFLGAGGMGSVYRAEDLELKRTVALKLIRGEMLASDRTRLRFQRESAALARLDHPGLCTAYRAGTTDGQPWIAMRLVRGTTLAEHIAARTGSSHGRRDVLQIVSWFESIARALATAHAVGVVHRDLKPGNIVLTAEGGPVVIDFGLVHFADAETHLTLSGDHIGTPAYMAPEQVQADGREVAATTDVYALGVTLFEALTGASPYPAKSREELFQCIARGRRQRLRQVATDLPADLEFVLEKALEPEPARRYASMSEFAEDLRRFRVHEPLLAGPPSTWYRLRKLVRRYPGRLAAGGAVFVTALIGAVVALQFALREQAKVRDFDLLAGIVLHEDAIAVRQALYPPWPHRITAMQEWLQRDCQRLQAMQPAVVRTIAELRSRALPETPADREADRRTHPAFAEHALLTKRIAAWRYAQAIRDGKLALVVPDLAPAQQALDAQTLSNQAWCRVMPPAKSGEAETRTIYGEEPLGLAFARAALAKAAGTAVEYMYRDTLADALLANGQDREALLESEEAVASAPDVHVERYRQLLQEREAASAGAAATLAAAESRLAILDTELAQRRTFRHSSEAEQFLHRTLVDLLARLESLTAVRDDVAQDLGWAKRIADVSRHHPQARHTWDQARDAIARADDVVASKRYAGKLIELRDEDVIGLVPLGMNPSTKLWEFYDLRSAWDGKRDPAALSIPTHDDQGHLTMGDDTGLVFVLLPGGRFDMGAQPDAASEANFDPMAEGTIEAVHMVDLGPFFLSRFEMTQGQWYRLATGDDATRLPSNFLAGRSLPPDRAVKHGTFTLASPVEQVSWTMCQVLLRRHQLCLPTEAQWEYACRGGTTTPWFSGKQPGSLAGFANLRDLSAQLTNPQWGPAEAFDDEYAVHAPVGSFHANPFGLHDMVGNVHEWCDDVYAPYVGERPEDGKRPPVVGSSEYMARGGGFASPASLCRSAHRNAFAADFRGNSVGLRPMRPLQPLAQR